MYALENVLNSKDNTPLIKAASKGDIYKVEKLVKTGSKINKSNPEGNTPLHQAAIFGHSNVVELLIKNKASVNRRNVYDQTPLMCAAMSGNVDILELLIKSKANVNRMDKYDGKDRYTALSWAIEGGHYDFFEKLLKYNAVVSRKKVIPPLVLASYSGHLRIIEKLVSMGVDINYSIDGCTPFLEACKKTDSNIDIVKFFLSEKNTDINKTDMYGNTSIMLALQADNIDVVKLVATFENINKASKNGFTPLLLAAYELNFKMVKVLLELGADPNKANIKSGKTPIMYAMTNNRIDITELLLDYNADINIKDKYGFYWKNIINDSTFMTKFEKLINRTLTKKAKPSYY